MDALNVSKVTINYDVSDVVRDVSFSVPHGQIFGLIGLNGAGKTTLIKSVLGLHSPRLGGITILGQDYQNDAAKNDIIYLPERFDPPSFLTGLEFIKFSCDFYHVPVIRDRIDDLASALLLSPNDLQKRIGLYSKGMRQKLGLIATILTGAKLIILDEPMSGLDPLARNSVKNMILTMKGSDQTVVMCSHILSDLDEMCERIAVLHEGRLQFVGKPQTLKDEMGEPTLERAFLMSIDTAATAAGES